MVYGLSLDRHVHSRMTTLAGVNGLALTSVG